MLGLAHPLWKSEDYAWFAPDPHLKYAPGRLMFHHPCLAGRPLWHRGAPDLLQPPRLRLGAAIKAVDEAAAWLQAVGTLRSVQVCGCEYVCSDNRHKTSVWSDFLLSNFELFASVEMASASIQVFVRGYMCITLSSTAAGTS
jgi:hypothetical protein